MGGTCINGLLLIDKAPGWTSHDVVAKCRGLLRERRIGHAGTLDPMATGLLLLLVGRATRAASLIEGTKTYEAALRFGVETDTQDITGRVTARSGILPDAEALRACLPRFTGQITQLPPMVSAVKIGGERLYKLAREGKTVERAPRPATVYALDWLGEKDGEHLLTLRSSAGFYVRTLIHDLGHALGTYAVMTALRRTAIDGFSVAEAVSVEQAGETPLLPLDALFAALPALTIPEACLKAARNGAAFPAPDGIAEGQRCRCYAPDGTFWLLGQRAQGQILTVKSFFEI